MSRIVVLACGNPARGDDALGPAFAAEAAALAAAAPHAVETQTDFQLSPEHALDLAGCDAVLFVDASVDATPPFRFAPVRAARDRTFTSHAMSPAAVLAAHADAFGPPPPAFALAIRGLRFDLGAPMTAAARRHLAEALAFFRSLLADPQPGAWAARAASSRDPA
jgi:hydrogenase maturation protease